MHFDGRIQEYTISQYWIFSNMLMLGMEVNTAIHIFIIYQLSMTNILQNSVFRPWEKILSNFIIWLVKIYKVNLRDKWETIYDSRTCKKNMLIGSLVYKLKPTCEKFESPWAGPSIFTQKFGPLVYKIRNRNKTENIHHDRLKPFLSAETQSSWVEKTNTPKYTSTQYK